MEALSEMSGISFVLQNKLCYKLVDKENKTYCIMKLNSPQYPDTLFFVLSVIISFVYTSSSSIA